MSHILYIDPDTALTRTYSRALQHIGHSVAYAATAQQALTLAEERQPDLVVLELQLVGHDGIEFLHEFRSYQEWLNVPVIVLTHMPPERLLMVTPALKRDFGVRDCLYKPEASFERLLASVNKVATAL